ncbi:macrolide export ATP-binding/permease protein MacB [Flavobacteriaceae bacterium UJ101]|nr:macrolide export ATP-binding/permease protein MacB [Flavobacteriaceae bacterium UJ101]
MFDLDRWREIWNSISSNKLRTFLSGFTIALALFVFITLSGLGQGLQNGFESEFFDANSLNISLSGGRTTISYKGFQEGRQIQFENEDYDFLKSSFPSFIKYIKSTLTEGLTIRYGKESGNYSITGTQPVYAKMTEDELIQGRNLMQKDLDNLSKVVVIGKLIVSDLFKNENPIGKYLQMDGNMYQVIGVFSSEDGDDAERIAYVPLTTLQVIYGSTKNINQIEITPIDGMSIDQISTLANTITAAMRAKHDVAPNDQRGIRLNNGAEEMSSTNSFLLVITVIVFFIGFGSLVAGVVSIANIMVFTVKERTKEIGIRKALGATPRNIVGLILQEAMTITIISGYIGIAIATILVNNIEDDLKDYFIKQPNIEPYVLVMASIILLIAGLVAGWIPARRASKIKPIVALRDD